MNMPAKALLTQLWQKWFSMGIKAFIFKISEVHRIFLVLQVSLNQDAY